MRPRTSKWTLFFCYFILLASALREDEEKLIGWKGETYDRASSSDDPPQSDPERKPWIETISWRPRVFLYHNFMSDAEARHIKRTAAPMMKRSSVVGNNGSSDIQDYRTSYGTFVSRVHDPVIQTVLQRVATWVKAPVENHEDLQVLRYGVGQKYGAHTDSLIDDSPRMATILLYLHDTEEGGETAFPETHVDVTPELEARLGPFSSCARGRVAFRPRKGDALMFWSLKPDGTHDDMSSHEGCPVVRGVKWTATAWIHSMPFQPARLRQQLEDRATGKGERDGEPGMCDNMHTSCDHWASVGECDKNPDYMAASCARACGKCEVCSGPSDLACINRNRAKLGFLVYDAKELDG